VNIDVDDLERGILFYTRAFELGVGRHLGESVVELVGARVPIYLLAKHPETPPFDGASAGRNYDRHWTPVHLDFVVDGLEVALRRAEAAGARLEGSISDQVWGRMARISDPFGHGLCLLEFKGRGYDEIESTGSGANE